MPVEGWKTVKNCFRYISATDSRVVTFDESNWDALMDAPLSNYANLYVNKTLIGVPECISSGWKIPI